VCSASVHFQIFPHVSQQAKGDRPPGKEVSLEVVPLFPLHKPSFPSKAEKDLAFEAERS